MRQFVRVLPASEFDSWVSKRRKAAAGGGGGGGAGGGGGGGQTAGPNGEELFTSAGCVGCHTLKAAGATAKVGPEPRQARRTRSAAFIRQSIVDPNAKVTKGYQHGIMPQNFGEQLSKEELDALVKYLLESQE